MKVLRWRGLYSIPVLSVSGYFTHWLTVAAVLGLPPLYDLWYYHARDKRRRYRPAGLTRWVYGGLFGLPRSRSAEPPVLPESKRSSGYWPPEVRAAIFRRDGGRCRCSGCPRCLGRPCTVTYDLQIDHVVPRSRGGVSTVRNGQLMCGPCNRYKSDKMPALNVTR